MGSQADVTDAVFGHVCFVGVEYALVIRNVSVRRLLGKARARCRNYAFNKSSIAIAAAGLRSFAPLMK